MYKFLILIIFNIILSQTTGKISGVIKDNATNQPIIGANVVIIGAGIGAATDLEGNYFIINIDPGTYNLRVDYIGYESVIIKNVNVSVNRTSAQDILMKQSFVTGAVVEVTGNPVDIKKDQTSTVKNISSDQIDILPVEDVSSIISMQAGVVAGSFRGGRSTEVTYLIDGMSVNEGFGGSAQAVTLEPDAISEIEVITGTFNAEYGKAMSGVVNQITKSGSNKFKISTNYAYSNYLTNNSDIFKGIDQYSLNNNNDFRFQFSGPVLKDKIFFFINGRQSINNNHLNGYDYFDVNDSSNYSADDPVDWYSQHSGNYVDESVCMNSSGEEILTKDGDVIEDSSLCESVYGECIVTLKACLDIVSNEYMFLTNNQNLCQTQGGQYSENFVLKLNGYSFEECNNEVPSYYENIYGINTPLVNTVFNGNAYTFREKNTNMVPMNNTNNSSIMAKLLYKITDKWKTSFIFSKNEDSWYNYNHSFRYNPNGRAFDSRITSFYALQSNYMVNQSMFFDFKYSMMKYFYGYFVYDNPQDKRYVSDLYLQAVPDFFTGGQEKSHSKRSTIDNNFKIDCNWQVNKRHNLKAGFDLIYHQINNDYYTIRPNPDSTEYSAYIFTDTLTTYNDIFEVSPYEFSSYIQDKMEFDAMVINLGFRFDYFDPKILYPTEYRNPLNLINEVDSSNYKQASSQTQISPRLGIAYQVADEAVLHFSYGHFFQMPPFYSMYNRSDWLVPSGNYETIMGNPNISAEKTVSYEIGLWQRLNRYMSLDMNLYYRDIYELLGTKTITTYDQVKYGLYTNKDYGNVRGMEIKFDVLYNKINFMSNYTLQYTRGVADSPTQAFSREGNSQDPINTLIPMSWDQRHTFNASLGYNVEGYGFTITSYYNSGTTYSFEPMSESSLAGLNLLPNNSYKPSNISVDLRAHYLLKISDIISGKVVLSIYNVFDRLNEMSVHSDTGRAYYSIITDTERAAYRSTFSDLEDVYANPGMFSSPRHIKVSLELKF